MIRKKDHKSRIPLVSQIAIPWSNELSINRNPICIQCLELLIVRVAKPPRD